MSDEIKIIDDGAEMTEKQAAEFAEFVETAQTAQATAQDMADDQAAPRINGILSPEEFEQHFIELFDICGDLWDMPDFKVNRDKPFEFAGAKVSAAKLYLMAQKYQMLHFLIEPCGGWFGDMIAIGCFVGAKANVACKRFTGNGLTGYFKRFMKKTSETVEKNGFFKRVFGKKGEEKEVKDD